MKRQHSVLIVRVHGAKSLAAQAGSIPAHREQFSSEPHVVEHLLVALIQARPVEEQIAVRNKIVRPLLVLQKFLPHEQHGNTRRGETEPGRHMGTAGGESGTGIRRIPKTGDAPLPAPVNNVVIFRPLHEAPLLLDSFRPRLRASRPVMLRERSSGALALPMTSRIAMRKPSVKVVSKPASSGAAFTTY
jgi:hypothetical protein